MAVTVRDFDHVALMGFKRGFDSLAGEVRGIAVTGTPGAFVGGQQTFFSLFQVDRLEDIDKSLEITTSGRAQIKFGRGAGRTKFVSQLKLHEFSVYVVVAVRVIKGTRQLENVQLVPEDAELLTTDQGKEQFRKQFGDEFLSGVTSGGEFIAFLEVQTNDRTDHEEIQAKFSGGVVGGIAEGGAEFNSVLTQIKSNHQLRVFSFQSGGSDPNLVVTPETMVQKAITFPSTVTGENVFDFLATFESYDILPRPADANPIEIAAQRARLDKLGELLLQFQSKVDGIDYILLNKEQFANFDSAQLVAQRNKLAEAINQMTDQAAKCFNDRSQCELPTLSINPAEVTLPERLPSTDIEAIKRAKKAVEEAQGHAAASKQHAARVLEISRTIQTGPKGKKLVDEAKVELDNASKAAELALDSASTAIVVGDATPAAGELADAARSAVKQAEDAVKLAKSLQKKIADIGLAPFWNAPTQLKMQSEDLRLLGGDNGTLFRFINIFFGDPSQTLRPGQENRILTGYPGMIGCNSRYLNGTGLFD